jgi:serine/threonine-protein kinase HipA
LLFKAHADKSHFNKIDYLLYSPDDRAGALGFGLNKIPPAPKRLFNQTIELEKLQKIADMILNDEDTSSLKDHPAEELLLIGTSMGGARPKTIVKIKKDYGSPNLIIMMTNGIMPALNMQC